LGDLVESVLMAFLSFAKCLSLFRNVHHLIDDGKKQRKGGNEVMKR
jgi:hypothetical protein